MEPAPSRGSASKRGSLFAIGGREARTGSAEILRRFVECLGGSEAELVVLTAASTEPEKRRLAYSEAFRSLGISRLSFFHHQDRREMAADQSLLEAIERADGVFFPGGNQLKLVTTLGGTPAEARLRERHAQGLHLGGSSAGASALSSVMIARGKPRSAARLASVRMAPGLGILRNVVIDQHFRERDRFGRLITAVLCNPSMLGFGLDENTAFVLDPDDRVSVLGSGSLTILDGSRLAATNVDVVHETSPAGFAGMRMHALTEGWTYDFATQTVQRPALDPNSRKAAG